MKFDYLPYFTKKNSTDFFKLKYWHERKAITNPYFSVIEVSGISRRQEIETGLFVAAHRWADNTMFMRHGLSYHAMSSLQQDIGQVKCATPFFHFFTSWNRVVWSGKLVPKKCIIWQCHHQMQVHLVQSSNWMTVDDSALLVTVAALATSLHFSVLLDGFWMTNNVLRDYTFHAFHKWL